MPSAQQGSVAGSSLTWLTLKQLQKVFDISKPQLRYWRRKPSRLRRGEKALRVQEIRRGRYRYCREDLKTILRGEESDPNKPGAGQHHIKDASVGARIPRTVLRELLQDGPRRRPEVIRLARKQGVSRRRIYKAAKELKIVLRRRDAGVGAWWCLPGQTIPNGANPRYTEAGETIRAILNKAGPLLGKEVLRKSQKAGFTQKQIYEGKRLEKIHVQRLRHGHTRWYLPEQWKTHVASEDNQATPSKEGEEVLKVLKRRGARLLSDIAWELDEKKDTIRARLTVLKEAGRVTSRRRNVIGRRGNPLGEWMLAESSPEATEQQYLSNEAETILGVLREQGKMRLADLAEHLHLPTAKLYYRLCVLRKARLVDSLQVTRQGRLGKPPHAWSLTEPDHLFQQSANDETTEGNNRPQLDCQDPWMEEIRGNKALLKELKELMLELRQKVDRTPDKVCEMIAENTPRQVINPTDARGQWMYEKRLAGTAWKNIVAELKQIASEKGWESLEDLPAAATALRRWCKKTSAPYPAK
jgi:predicted ArsR family transcriptional regulator